MSPLELDSDLPLIVTLRPQSPAAQSAYLHEEIGLDVGSQTLLLNALDIAVVSPTVEQRQRLVMMAAGELESVNAFGGVNNAELDSLFEAAAGPPFGDDADASWGIHAIGAFASTFTGAGVRIAILDTGLPADHGGFGQRVLATSSFVPGQTAHDQQSGHGLACASIAAGGRIPGDLRRLGVAPEAELFISRVLGNDEVGRKSWILAGIDWALQHGCQIVSMSLASKVSGPVRSTAFERAGQRALARGCLLIASAGNKAGDGLVSQPANSDSILAVGSVDSHLDPAPFSPTATPNLPAAAIDVVGPGVGTAAFSLTDIWKRHNGNSMATAYVAGLAALHVQASRLAGAEVTGRALWDRLLTSTKPANGLPERVGHGVPGAP